MFLIDYAAAQPCTVHCPGGLWAAPTRHLGTIHWTRCPLPVARYELNWPSIWGGKNMNDKQQGNYQVYDGVIVRSPWKRDAPLSPLLAIQSADF